MIQFQQTSAFSVGTPSSMVPMGVSSCPRSHQRRQFCRTAQVLYALDDNLDFDYDSNHDDDEDDDDDYIDTDSLGDWRKFRRSLALLDDDDNDTNSDTASQRERTKRAPVVSVSKENEDLLATQNEELHQEYTQGVWAHKIATPEVGGLVVRMPLEVELYRNKRHSIAGRRLHTLLDDGETVEMGTWYARAKNLIDEGMKTIASAADDSGQIDATGLNDESSELLTLFLENQETWQEVCLVVSKNDGTSRTLVLNRPMAFKLTENLGQLVLNGAFRSNKKGLKLSNQKDLLRFMVAFSNECAVYVGGPDNQGEPATMIHGIAGLPGAVEISKGSGIYEGGIDAAVEGVLEGKYNPLEFRFFVGCHLYEDSLLDREVHLGKYQPIACARSLALKQCISLPKPLWHEVLELCGGDMIDLSTLELMKTDDMQYQVIDEIYDEDADFLEGDDDDDRYR